MRSISARTFEQIGIQLAMVFVGKACIRGGACFSTPHPPGIKTRAGGERGKDELA
jgi:hypothetical protein